MTLDDLDAAFRRCSCATATLEPLPDAPQILRCTACRGWVTLRIMSAADLAAFERYFRTPAGSP